MEDINAIEAERLEENAKYSARPADSFDAARDVLDVVHRVERVFKRVPMVERRRALRVLCIAYGVEP